jgi:hypothetical protein
VNRTIVIALAASALMAGPAVARECGEGSVQGGSSVSGDALQNRECATLAKVYCRIAEDRDAGLQPEEAVRHAADWLGRLNRTGSNTRANWAPILGIAANDVYRNRERRPGPTYYRAAYGCGVVRRLPDAKAQQQAGRQFDAAADRCEKEHALTGQRSYPNQPLRDCLAAAVDQIAPPPK